MPLQRPLQRRRNCRRLRLQVKHFCIGDIFTFAIFWNISYIFILATFPYLLHSYIGNIFKLAEFFHLIPFHICYIHFHLLSAESELTLLLFISWAEASQKLRWADTSFHEQKKIGKAYHHVGSSLHWEAQSGIITSVRMAPSAVQCRRINPSPPALL